MRLFSRLSRWFWVGGLGAGVVLLAAFSVFALILGAKERNWRMIGPCAVFAAMAVRAWKVLDLRLHPPLPPPQPLELKVDRIHD